MLTMVRQGPADIVGRRNDESLCISNEKDSLQAFVTHAFFLIHYAADFCDKVGPGFASHFIEEERIVIHTLTRISFAFSWASWRMKFTICRIWSVAAMVKVALLDD